MVSNFIESLEAYVVLLYIIHIIISAILAFILMFFLAKRFKRRNEEIDKRDVLRLEGIENRSLLFKLLFRVSLHKNNAATSFFFIFLFNLSMPILGYIASLWITYYIRVVKYEKHVSNTNILNLDEFGISFLKIERIFGEGSMSDLMTSKYAPKSKKLKALSSLASSMSPANLKIIRQTLTSTDDEIRMFGYAILNKAEKALSIKINKQLNILNAEYDEDDKSKKETIANAAKELAPLYWEMIYTELSHESLKKNFLTEVKKYINIAKDFYIQGHEKVQDELEICQHELQEYTQQENQEETTETTKEILQEKLYSTQLKATIYNETCSKLYILMGRVYMNEHNYNDAKTEFTLAQELSTEELSYILPYLAEIHFITGNYKITKAILNQSETLGLNPTLYPIMEQWKVS